MIIANECSPSVAMFMMMNDIKVRLQRFRKKMITGENICAKAQSKEMRRRKV
jgi:hypothetical protein